MDSNLTERQGDTVRLLRPPPRVITEITGRNVWLGGISELDIELELVAEEPDFDPYSSV